MTLHVSRRRGNLSLVGMLVVLLIIAILVNNQLSNPGGGGYGTVNNATANIEKGREAACTANRVGGRLNVNMWLMQNQGQTPTMEALNAAGMRIQPCPDGGTYTFLEGGEIHCSKHAEKFQQIHNPGSEIQAPTVAANIATMGQSSGPSVAGIQNRLNNVSNAAKQRNQDTP